MEKSVYIRPIFTKLAAAKQQRILSAAIEEFSRWGYEKASINRLVQRLGIAKGSIFQYFGSKENLYFHVFQHAVNLVRATLKQVKVETRGDDFFLRLGKSLEAGVDFIQRHPRIYQIYLKMLFQEDFPLWMDLLRTIRLFSIDYLQPLIEEGMARGELRADLQPQVAAFLLDAVFDRFLQAHCVAYMDAGLGLFQAKSPLIQSRIKECIETLRWGLANPAAAAGAGPASSADRQPPPADIAGSGGAE